MISVRQEMADIENMAQKIASLGNEIQNFKIDTAVNGRLGEILGQLYDIADPTIRKLRSVLEYYEGIFSDFERKIESI